MTDLPLFLLLETATNICSVALSQGENILSLRESDEDRSHSSLLTPFMREVLEEAGKKPADVNAIAVSKGPGSYTGLRIGVSATKGFAYSLNIPVIGISTLQALALSAISHGKFNTIHKKNPSLILCPMIDARRMEVYTAMYDPTGIAISSVSASIIAASSFDKELSKSSVLFFGNGSDKVKELIAHPNAYYLEGVQPSAQYLASLAQEAFMNKRFEDTAYFEPYYLKDFVASLPRKKMF